MPDWTHCEGQIISGEFPLERHLGGNETTAVFLTRLASNTAAIEVRCADRALAGELVDRWNHVAVLHHPHLAEIYAAGIGMLAGESVAYLVTEYAEENLEEVLHDRQITMGEAREMLLPVSDALAYLHSQGLVHGNLKPSNILAVGDTVKISSEAVSAGDPAGDIRALGTTLVKALTGRAEPPDGRHPVLDALPSPFREIAENCLQGDPERRWTADKVASWLRSPGQATSSGSVTVPAMEAATPKPQSRRYLAVTALAVAVAVIIGAMAMHRRVGPISTAGGSRASLPDSSGRNGEPSAPSPIPPAQPGGEAARARLAQDGITRRVLPKIPEKARNTIEGKPSVVVRVTVDPAGKVMEATLERSFSPYFGKLVLEAARQWQFAPEESLSSRNWILRFEITRNNTQVTARRADRE